MKTSNKLIALLSAILLIVVHAPVNAATAAGAGIKLNGSHVGGYTITHGGESREALVGQLAERTITFERDFKIPVDAKNPDAATLKGEIEITSRIAGDRQVAASVKELRLVKRDGDWHVDAASLKQALEAKEQKREEGNPAFLFQCTACSETYQKCSSCGHGAEGHDKMNHPPEHDDCKKAPGANTGKIVRPEKEPGEGK